MTAGAGRPRPTDRPHRNDVHIVGRLSTAAEQRDLPSGDQVVTWRLVVNRESERRGVDVIDCAAFAARVRRAAVKWQPGEVIEIEGALRRRFWRSSGGTASRFEVEVNRASRA